MVNSVYLPEIDGGGHLVLSDLLKLIPELQKKYGKHAYIFFDAVYNNVQVMIQPTKKLKEKDL